MKRTIKRLQPKQQVILRLAFEGWSNTRIAAEVGLRRETVSRVLNSPPAQAELGRMQAEAEEWLVDIPGQMWVMSQINGDSFEERRLQYRLARDKYRRARKTLALLEYGPEVEPAEWRTMLQLAQRPPAGPPST